MSECTESVKAVEAYLRENADRSKERGNADLVAKLTGHADSLSAARRHILHLEGLTSALPPDLGNIHDLPQELLEELTVAKTDEIEDQIVTVINAYNGEATLDQILVGLYRKFKVLQKRRFIQNKLYKMTMVWNVPGRKGVYTTTEPDGENEPKAVGDFTVTAEDLQEGLDSADEIPF